MLTDTKQADQLKTWQRKKLYQDSQEQNCLPKSVDIKTIIQGDDTFYGENKTSKRKSFQNHWYYVRKLSLDKFVEALSEVGVTPCKAISDLVSKKPPAIKNSQKQELKETQPPAESEDEYDDEYDDEYGIVESEEEAEADNYEQAQEHYHIYEELGKMSMRTPSTRTRPGSARKNLFAGKNDSDSTFTCIQRGNKAYPTVIILDSSRPEECCGFSVEVVSGATRRKKDKKKSKDTVEKLHIRREAPVADVPDWTATVPSHDDLPNHLVQFAQRSVLVKAPSQSHSLRELRRYHRKVTCNVTQNAHLATRNDIEEDENRASSYYLIVYKDQLNNYFFSGDPTDIDKHEVTMMLKPGEIEGVEDPISTSIVYWDVAVRNSDRTIKKAPTKVKTRRFEMSDDEEGSDDSSTAESSESEDESNNV